MDDHSVNGCAHLTCFSQNHGRNVILLENNTVAYRKASFANAVTVSEQPVLPGEIFLVEIEQTEPGWTGHMRLGLTQQHPNSPLPLYSIPDLSDRGDSWICAITKYHNDVRVRPRRRVSLFDYAIEGRPVGSRAVVAAPTASAGVDQPNNRREADAAPTASAAVKQPNDGREADALPAASAVVDQPNGGREACAAPTASAEVDQPNCGRKAAAAPTAFAGVDQPNCRREADAAPTASMDEGQPDSGIEADTAPTASAGGDQPYSGQEADASPTASAGDDQPYSGQEADASPTASAGGDQPYSGQKAYVSPTASAEGDQPYSGQEADASPIASAGGDQPYSGQEADASPTASAGGDQPYSGQEADASPTAYSEEDQPYGTRNAFSAPSESAGEHWLSDGREASVNHNVDFTRYQDNSVPEMSRSTTINGLPPYQTSQNSSYGTTSKNCSTESKPFLCGTTSASDYCTLTPSLCNNTLLLSRSNGFSVNSSSIISPKCDLNWKSVSNSSTRGTEIFISRDVIEGMSAYLPSDLVWELANCGISSNTSPIDKTAVTTNKCNDNACDNYTSNDIESKNVSDSHIETQLTDCAMMKSCSLLISSADECNGVATFAHKNFIPLNNHDCTSNQMHGSETHLMHGTTTSNDIPDVSYDNPSISTVESKSAEGACQSSGAIEEDETLTSSASFASVNDKPSALTKETLPMVPDSSSDNLVDSREERNSTNENTPPLAAANSSINLDVNEGHVIEVDDGEYDGGVEYESCLTRLAMGDHLCTSRGLVPRSLLLPSAEYRGTTLPLATDEGSRIGLLYLPQVDGYAEMHYIINGEDQGVFTRLLPYQKGPLHAVVDVYGTTKKVRIVQLYGVVSLKSACRATILQCLAPNAVSVLPLPPQLQRYLLGDSAPHH